jgi:ATP adenylyltransferase
MDESNGDPERGIDGVGIPDRWLRIWAPHRENYLAGENRPLPGNEVPCPFCKIPKSDDETSLIVYRGKYLYVVLNLYPYNPGHILIPTYRHIADYTELTIEERLELTEITAHAMATIRKVSNPAGFNIGINQGDLAGAGIPDHFHQHIVPRWKGDANFMPIIGGVKIMSQLLDAVREEFARAW